jgi:hypothetical protein
MVPDKEGSIMATSSSDPKADILFRYHELVKEWNTNAAEITRLQTAQLVVSQRAQDFIGAARVFGFDLISEYNQYAAQIANATATQYIVQPVQTPIAAPRNRTVRDIVLEAAERAYPNPVRATSLRQHLEVQGILVHGKTVGMTLYRLSQEQPPLVKRVGKADWFFVPEAERQEPAGLGGEGNPGSDPGLLLNAAE